MMGRIFSHHCVLGMRCLQSGGQCQLLLKRTLKYFKTQQVCVVSLKICVCLQICKGLESQRPLPHAEHTGGVRCVGKDATYKMQRIS